MTSIRSRHTLHLLCSVLILTAHARGSAGQAVSDIEASAKNGRFQEAFVQSRAVVVVAPSLDGITQLRALFAKYPEIQEAGVSMTGSLIDAAQTEQNLLRAQSELRFFVKFVNFAICDPGALAALQARFVAAASTLILDAGLPVTFESNLLPDWSIAAGSSLDKPLERRIYQNTMANITARDPRDTPSVLMADRLFRYLQREPEARQEALPTLERVEWRREDFDGPLREVYPELAEKRGHALASLQFDTRGVEFGPWVRRFLAQVMRNWLISPATTSLRGNVLVSFNVHKNGAITDVAVVRTTGVDAFSTSSFNAIAASNPTVPLPPEYPEEKAPITITFYYNETPPQK